MNSKIGPLFLVASAQGLESIFWQAQDVPFIESLSDSNPESIILKNAVQQLEQYLNGQRTSFDLKLAAEGTKFQKKVWQELSKIPFGKTTSYIEIARKIGNEKASRAVGAANGKNPLCIVVPCHRVVNANGKPGGYSGGLQIKEKLLNLEAAVKV